MDLIFVFTSDSILYMLGFQIFNLVQKEEERFSCDMAKAEKQMRKNIVKEDI